MQQVDKKKKTDYYLLSSSLEFGSFLAKRDDVSLIVVSAFGDNLYFADAC